MISNNYEIDYIQEKTLDNVYANAYHMYTLKQPFYQQVSPWMNL